jgi:hypothetical protein
VIVARIRTLKPDAWHDEAFEGLSRDARLLFVGLITQADDEGRQKGNPALLRSLIYPYDLDLEVREVAAWLDELERANLVVRYEHEGREYVYLPGWRSNQRITHPSPSKLPAPGVVESPREALDRAPDADALREEFERPHAGGKPAKAPRARKAKPDPDSLPEGFPADLAPVVEAVRPLLVEVAEHTSGTTTRKAILPTTASIARALLDYPRRDYAGEARKYRAWQLERARQAHKDPARGYRNWLENAPEVADGARANGPTRDDLAARDAEALRRAGLA